MKPVCNARRRRNVRRLQNKKSQKTLIFSEAFIFFFPSDLDLELLLLKTKIENKLNIVLGTILAPRISRRQFEKMQHRFVQPLEGNRSKFFSISDNLSWILLPGCPKYWNVFVWLLCQWRPAFLFMIKTSDLANTRNLDFWDQGWLRWPQDHHHTSLWRPL